MLRALEIKNFTVFEEAKLEFSPGLNVVIGENGTGKSHLLKLGYCMTQISFESGLTGLVGSEQERITRQLSSVFHAEKLGNLISFRTRNLKCEIKTFFKRNFEKPSEFGFDSIDIGFDIEFQSELVFLRKFTTSSILIRPLTIPTKEILSIHAGFAAALRNRELGFDSTYLDLADALALTPLKGEASKSVKPIIETLETQMDGKVVVENGRFYISTDNQKLEMPLVAEGIRKIAMLAYLLMNGSLQKGTTLFWDEPETNLNPKMIRHLAETLVILSSMGIQIVLATHSLFLLRELQIQLALNPNVPANFFALEREGKSVTVQQGNSIYDVDPIAALEADLEQTDRYLELT
jgi:energy-coupling factor transporter ATP-binding protein EcfA2